MLSPADIKSLMGDGGCNGNEWLMIILFAMIFGWNGGGFGNNNALANAIGYENLATSAEVQRGFDNQNSMANEREILASINQNALQGMQNANQNTQYVMGAVNDKYNEMQRDIANVAMMQQQAIANQGQCCASTQLGMAQGNAALAAQIAQNEYNNAMRDAATNANFTAQIQGLKDTWYEDKIAGLQQEVTQLRGVIGNQGIQSQLNEISSKMLTYPQGWTYNAGPAPFCNCGSGCNI